MLLEKEIKKNAFVWWAADRYMSDWSCPGIITKVTTKDFVLVTFDDFKENILSIKDHTEISVCSDQDVKDYIVKRKRYFEDRGVKLKRDLDDFVEESENYNSQTKLVLNKIK